MNDVDFVCISLINRKDRRTRVTQTFDQLGITDRINWWCVEKHPRSGVLGCFESHVSVWMSPEFKRPYLCVFEDDILINHPKMEIFYDVINKLDMIFDNSDTVILNMDPQYFYTSGTSSYSGMIYGYGANCSAYIIPRHHLNLVINYVTPKFGVPVDIALYGLPMLLIFLFYQEKTDSDINPELLQVFNPVPKTTYDILLRSNTFGRFMAYSVHRYCMQHITDKPIINRHVI